MSGFLIDFLQRLTRQPPRYAPPEGAQVIVREGEEVTGSLAASGTIWISGPFTGEVVDAECVILAEGAYVREGSVTAGRIEIYGTVETGEIRAERGAVLHSSSVVRAGVRATNLVVHEGADFTGQSAMVGPPDAGSASTDGEKASADPSARAEEADTGAEEAEGGDAASEEGSSREGASRGDGAPRTQRDRPDEKLVAGSSHDTGDPWFDRSDS